MGASGLVQSAVSRQDARVTEVSLTALGEARLAEARAAASPVYHRLIRDVSARDFDKLTSLLGQLYDNLSDA